MLDISSLSPATAEAPSTPTFSAPAARQTLARRLPEIASRLGLWLVAIVYAANVASTLGRVVPYAFGHWLHNYDHGVIPRGLIGELVQPLTEHKTGPELRMMFGYVFDFILVVSIGATLAAVHRMAKAGREDGTWLLGLLGGLMLAASPYAAVSGFTVGYFDQILAAGMLGTLVLVRRGHWVVAGLATGVGVLIHELYALWGLPIVVYAGLLALACGGAGGPGLAHARDNGWMRRSLPLLWLAMPGVLATIALILASERLDPGAAESLERQIREAGVIDAAGAQMSVYHLQHSFLDAFADQHGAGLERALNGSVLTSSAAALLGLLGASATLLAVRRHALLIPVLVAAVMSPMAAHWIAWDTGRITSLAIFSAFAGLFATLTGLPRGGRPLSRRLSIGALALGIGVAGWSWAQDAFVLTQPISMRSVMSQRSVLPPAAYVCSRPLFENSDFEEGSLLGWDGSGSAFTEQPLRGNPAVFGRAPHHVGEYWVGTFERYAPKKSDELRHRGDGATGRLVSQSFTLTEDRIVFLIGGGRNRSELYVALEVAGTEVERATGNEAERMHDVTWDVSAFRGREARIVVADESKDGWGHINVDGFCYAP